MARRIVVTGIGVVSSIGIGKENFWNSLINGKSGISDVSLIDVANFKQKRGGEIKDFNPVLYMKENEAKKYGRASQFGIAAARLAINDSKVMLSQLDSDRLAIIMGTTMANIRELELIDEIWTRKGEDFLKSDPIPKYPSHSLAFSIAQELKINPFCMVIPTACSAGNYSIGYGYDLIKSNQAEYVICGGADPFSRITFTGFGSLFAMASEKCQPFDKNRKGMMVGEGAGVLILEELTQAVRRKAYIYAEILGYGLSCDASHMTLPSIEGIVKVLRRALISSGIKNSDVDYISAHGTGTKANDVAESKAINVVFDGRKNLPVSSIKSMLGHTMGAASAMEAIACVLAIKHSIIPPTINFETSDEECEIDCVPNRARQKKIQIALNNSFAFGGNNACTVFSKYLS